MRISLHKYFVTAVAVISIFGAGIFVGCTGKEHATAAADKAVQKALAVMPDTLKGVHNVPAAGTVKFAFSPQGGITRMLVEEIGNAKNTILVQAYSFTSGEIAQALIDAHKRGVDVKVILDKSQETEQHSMLKTIAEAGIPVHIDRDFAIAHNKVMIIDGIDVITGSFNFTKAAEHSNAENCEIQQGNKPLADEFTKYWQWRWEATYK